MKKPDYLSNDSKYQWTPGEDMHQIKGEYGAITQAVNNVKGDTVDKAVKIILNNPFTSKDFFEALNIGNKVQAGTVAQYEIMLKGKKVRAQFIKQDNGNWRINPSFKTDFVYPEDKDLKIIQKTKDGEKIFYIDNEEIKVLSVKFIEKPKTPELKIVSQSNSENPKVNEKPSAEEGSQDTITQFPTPATEIKDSEASGNKQGNNDNMGSIDDWDRDWDWDLDWEVESSQKSKAPAQKEAGEAPMQEDDIQAPEDNDGMEDLKSQEKSGKAQEQESSQMPGNINSTENPKSQENIRSLAGLNAEQIAKIANAGNFNPEEYKKQPLHVNTRFTNFYDSAKELKKQQESLKGYNSPDFQNNIYNVEENQENLQNTETEQIDEDVLDEETLAKKEALIEDVVELLETDREKVENGKFNLFGYGINLIDFKDSIHKSNSIPELQKKKDKLIEEQRLLKRIVSNIKSIPWEIMKSDSIIFNISLKEFDDIEKSVDKVIDLLKQRIQDLEDVAIPEDETGDEGEKGDISRDNIIQNENSETSETPEQQYSIEDLKKAYEKVTQKIGEKDEENKIILDDGTIVVIDFQLDKPITFTFPDGSTIVENTREEIIIFKTKDGEEYKESLLKGLFGNGQFLNKYRNSLINKSSENSDEYIYKLPGGAIVTIDAFMNKAKISIPGDLEEEVDIKLIDNPKFHELSKEAQNAIEGYVYFSDDFEGQIKNAIEKIDIQGNTRTFIFKKGRFEYKAEGKAGGKMEFYEANFLGKFARKNDRVEEDFGNRRTRTYIFAKTGETFKEYINDDDYEKFYKGQAPEKISEAPESMRPKDYVRAVGDLGGSLETFMQLSRDAKIINEKGNYAGGNVQVVYVGDILADRAPQGFAILEYIATLKEQAKKAGGKIDVLVGNHDIFMIDYLLKISEDVFAYDTSVTLNELFEFTNDDIRNSYKEAKDEHGMVDTVLKHILKNFQGDILANMKASKKGKEWLRLITEMKLCSITKDALFFHCPPNKSMLNALKGEKGNTLHEKVNNLNARWKEILENVLLGDQSKKEEYIKYKDIFVHTGNDYRLRSTGESNDVAKKRLTSTDPIDYEFIIEAGIKTIAHGHTRDEMKPGTIPGINMISIDKKNIQQFFTNI